MKGVSLFLILTLVLGHIAPAIGTGMRCKDHPLYRKGMKGEMVRAWIYAPRRNRMFWTPATYIPRNTQYNFVPHDEPESDKFLGLDLFLTGFNGETQHNYLNVYYQRPAKTYLLVHGYDRMKMPATMEGWHGEGWVRRTSGHPYLKHKFGLGQRQGEIPVAYEAYVFSKTGKSVTIPSNKYIKRHIRSNGQMRTSGFFSLLIAESDGRPVRKPSYPAGMNVKAGHFCPRRLHDAWVAKEMDDDDQHTRGRTFRSWHPLWDPCFWCSYGHEHGSAAPLIMGYQPRYGYTALKNDRQDESHEGFKDIVADLESHWLYLSVHAKLSSGSRFDKRHHTMVVAAVRKRTKELELELRFKADYGALTVRKRHGGIVGVSKKDEELRGKFGYKRRHRLVNIINPRRIDPRWRYKKGGRLMRGEYEQWATQPMCSKIANGREPTVDFKDAALAKRDVRGRGTTRLGRMKDGRLRWNASVNRELRAKDWVIDGGLCEFGEGVHGKFYTDVYGEEMKDGPGTKNVRQFIKKGFRLRVSGDFETTDPWLGLYLNGIRGELRNIGFGIDETEN